MNVYVFVAALELKVFFFVKKKTWKLSPPTLTKISQEEVKLVKKRVCLLIETVFFTVRKQHRYKQTKNYNKVNQSLVCREILEVATRL